MGVPYQGGQIFLRAEEVEHYVFLHDFQKVNDHVVFLEVSVASVLLEQEFEVGDAWVFHTDSPCGEQPKLDDHGVRFFAELVIQYGNAHLKNDGGCWLQCEQVLKHVENGFVNEFLVE